MRFASAIAAALLAATASAQPKRELIQAPKSAPELRRLLTPAEAYQLAAIDLTTSVPEADRVFTRYLWLREHDDEKVKCLAADLNRVSRGRVVFRPVPLAGNRLVRFDLRKLSFDFEKDISEIIEVWEKLRFDPSFNELLTPDALKVVLSLPEERRPFAVVRDGSGFATMPLHKLESAAVVRIPPRHLDLKTVLAVQTATLSAAPVVTAEYFQWRALTQVQGKDKLYQTVWGGLYYQFKGIKKSTQKGKSDLDVLLERLGATGEVTAEQRTAKGDSGVTKKPRAERYLPARNRRLGDGPSAVVITEDVRFDSIDASQDPIMTLRRQVFRPDGGEIIWIEPNGFNAYALVNGQGELVDEVPQEIATDTTVPGAHPKVLQPAISCIRCHEAEGSDGWKPSVNEVQLLLANGFDVFGDVSDPDQPTYKTLQELGAEYKGNPDKFLKSARFAYQAAVLEATGPWGKLPPTAVVRAAAKRLEADMNAYWYGNVSPAVALAELGFEVRDKAMAKAILSHLLPPSRESLTFGFYPEDSRIARLKSDLPMSRVTWSFIYPYAQARAQREVIRILTGGKP